MRIFCCLIALFLLAIMPLDFAMAEEYGDDQGQEKPHIILDKTKAAKFVDSFDDVSALADEMGFADKKPILRTKYAINKARSFGPYTNAVETLKTDYSSDYDKLTDIAKKFDFTSAEDWAETGDAVMLAYFSLREDHQDQSYEGLMKQGLRPEMVKMIPPEKMHMIEQALNMTKAVQDVPKENLEIVKDLQPAISVGIKKLEQ